MIEDVHISKLVLLQNNPRSINKDQFNKLVKSLKKDPDFLDKRPILVNKKNGQLIVYAGNQRVLAAKKLKWKTIPCIIDEDLPDEILQHRIIKDNSHSGEWDWDILANEWDTEVLTEYAFDQGELLVGIDSVDTSIDDESNKKGKKTKCCPSCGYEL